MNKRRIGYTGVTVWLLTVLTLAYEFCLFLYCYLVINRLNERSSKDCGSGILEDIISEHLVRSVQTKV
jgi:hypothetical protein